MPTWTWCTSSHWKLLETAVHVIRTTTRKSVSGSAMLCWWHWCLPNLNYKLRYSIQVAELKFEGVDTIAVLLRHVSCGSVLLKVYQNRQSNLNKKTDNVVFFMPPVSKYNKAVTSYHHASDIAQGCAILWGPHDMVVVVQLECWCT